MRVLIPILILIVLAGAIGTVANADSTWEKGVLIVYYNGQYGTGWWVNQHYIVTAAHVVNYQNNTVVKLIGGYQAIGTTIYVDSSHDVAIIYASDTPTLYYVFRLSSKQPGQGDRIFVIGYPFELVKIVGSLEDVSENPRISEGVVAWTYLDKGIFEFSAATDSGNSGGPIVTPDGNVIGLVSFALKGNAAVMYYGSSVDSIRQALDKAGVEYSIGLSSNITENTSIRNVAIVSGLVSIMVTVMLIAVRRRTRA